MQISTACTETHRQKFKKQKSIFKHDCNTHQGCVCVCGISETFIWLMSFFYWGLQWIPKKNIKTTLYFQGYNVGKADQQYHSTTPSSVFITQKVWNLISIDSMFQRFSLLCHMVLIKTSPIFCSACWPLIIPVILLALHCGNSLQLLQPGARVRDHIWNQDRPVQTKQLNAT